MIYKYAEIGSPWRAPISEIKNYVVFLPFMTQDSCLLVMVSTYLLNAFPKPYFLWTLIKKVWSKESKAFSTSMVTI